MLSCPGWIDRGFPNRAAAAAAIMAAAMGGSARAHTAWADGTPIPDWVRKACCGPSDAHRLTPSQVHRVDGAYVIDGYPRPISDTQVLPSEDGAYWAFYGVTTGGEGETLYTSVFCFFAPAWG